MPSAKFEHSKRAPASAPRAADEPERRVTNPAIELGGRHQHVRPQLLVGPSSEHRSMYNAVTLRWRLLGVVVRRERATHLIGGTLQRSDAVETDAARLEDQAASQDWRQTDATVLDVLVPEFDFSSPCLVPLGVEVDEYIQAAEQIAVSAVEIDVDVEPPVGPGHVHAAAVEPWVGEQIGNAGERREIREKRGARKKVAERFHTRRKARVVGDLNLLPFVQRVEGKAKSLCLLERGVLDGDCARGLRVDEMVDDDVRKWFSRGVPRVVVGESDGPQCGHCAV